MLLLISITVALALSISFLCYMLVSNYENRSNAFRKSMEMIEVIPTTKPVEKEAKMPSLGWKPAHGVLIDDDYLSVGLEILEQTKGGMSDPELHELHSKLLSDAETACVVADNAIFRFMNNKDGTCSQ